MALCRPDFRSTPEQRARRQYEAGWSAYNKGARFNFHSNKNWQRGYMDAREHRILGDVEPSGNDRDRSVAAD